LECVAAMKEQNAQMLQKREENADRRATEKLLFTRPSELDGKRSLNQIKVLGKTAKRGRAVLVWDQVQDITAAVRSELCAWMAVHMPPPPPLLLPCQSRKLQLDLWGGASGHPAGALCC